MQNFDYIQSGISSKDKDKQTNKQNILPPKPNQKQKTKEIWNFIQHLIVGDIATVILKVSYVCYRLKQVRN